MDAKVKREERRKKLYVIINDKEQRIYTDKENPADTKNKEIYLDKSTDYGFHMD